MNKYSKFSSNPAVKPIVKISPSMPQGPAKPVNGVESDKPHPAAPQK